MRKTRRPHVLVALRARSGEHSALAPYRFLRCWVCRCTVYRRQLGAPPVSLTDAAKVRFWRRCCPPPRTHMYMPLPVRLGYLVVRASRTKCCFLFANHLPPWTGVGTVVGSFLWTCRAFLNMAKEVSGKKSGKSYVHGRSAST